MSSLGKSLVLYDLAKDSEGESSMELLTELQELSYSDNGTSHEAFTPFVDARQKADPVTLAHL